MRAKNYVILIIRRHAGEVDWILPLIYKFNKDIELITIFNDKNSYESLVNNSTLFKLWKKKCDKFYIIKKTDRILYKLLYKILTFLKINKLFKISKIEYFLLQNLFNFKKFEEKFKINKNKIIIILTTINNLSSIPYIIKLHSPNSKLIKYPESTMIYPNNKENRLMYIKKRNFDDKSTDLYLLPKNNINYYFGINIKKNVRERIITCRILRYEKWWLKKLISKKNNSKKFNIVVATRSPDNGIMLLSDYTTTILSIMKAAQRIDNSKVIFKIHPSFAELKLLINILRNFNKKNWRISKNHIISLAYVSNLCISMGSSVSLDILAINKPVIEFYIINKNKRESIVVYNKNKKKWSSFYEYKRLVHNVKNEKELSSMINKVKIKKLNLPKKNLFNKIIFDGLKTTDINKKIFNN